MTDSVRSGSSEPSGHSAEIEPISVVSAATASVPNAVLLFLDLIERNTSTLDHALIEANALAERRGWDRYVVEPWMPFLLMLRQRMLHERLVEPETDNQKRLYPEKQPKAAAASEAPDSEDGMREVTAYAKGFAAARALAVAIAQKHMEPKLARQLVATTFNLQDCAPAGFLLCAEHLRDDIMYMPDDERAASALSPIGTKGRQ